MGDDETTTPEQGQPDPVVCPVDGNQVEPGTCPVCGNSNEVQ